MNRYNHDNEFKQLVDDLVHCHVYSDMFTKIQKHGLDKISDFFKFVGCIENNDETINVIQKWPQYNHTMYIDTLEDLKDEIMGELADPKPLKHYINKQMITQEQYKQGLQTLSELGIPNTIAHDEPFSEQDLYEFSPLGLSMLIFDDDYVSKMIKILSDLYVYGYICRCWKINTLKSHDDSDIPELGQVLLMTHRNLEKSVDTYFKCKEEWFEYELDENYFIEGRVDI